LLFSPGPCPRWSLPLDICKIDVFFFPSPPCFFFPFAVNWLHFSGPSFPFPLTYPSSVEFVTCCFTHPLLPLVLFSFFRHFIASLLFLFKPPSPLDSFLYRFLPMSCFFPGSENCLLYFPFPPLYLVPSCDDLGCKALLFFVFFFPIFLRIDLFQSVNVSCPP